MPNLKRFLVRGLRNRPPDMSHSLSGIDDLKMLIAKGLIQEIRNRGILAGIHEAEFKVYSQFGDDGIIQYLIHQTQIPPSCRRFIEFGVEDYRESNTRFLLRNDNWTGLVLDRSEDAVNAIGRDPLYWRNDLTAVCAFIQRENINPLIARHGFSGEIGLLSIDIDGNDYWVWEGIEVVNPLIVIVEYNSVYGAQHAVSIPYEAHFDRAEAHFTCLFWGCSLKALCNLADKKGYFFVGSNSSGNNAYFVRKDKVGRLKPLSAQEGYVESKFRESRDAQGELSYLTGKDRLRIIEEKLVYDFQRRDLIKIKDLYDRR